MSDWLMLVGLKFGVPRCYDFIVHKVHISLAGDKHMRVTWVVYDESAPSLVEYGTSSGKYSSVAQGESTSYSYLLYSSGKIHHTVIGPLEPGTVYFYQCGGQGPEFQFKTPPAQFPITFAVAGDLGQTGWTKSTPDHIDQCKYDLHLLPGDLSYADYMQSRWDTFGELVQPLASARPWMEHSIFLSDIPMTHNDNNIFPEVSKFDPSRFENQKSVPPYSFVAFGGGTRICPGYEFARIEILVAIHYVVTQFTWKLCADNNFSRVPMPVPTQGLPIQITPRKPM